MGGLTPDTRGPLNAEITAVDDSATSVQLVAANPDRAEVIITNDSSARLYIAFGDTASLTNYTISLPQYGTVSTPFRGQINGIWATAPGDGAARITEES